MCLAVIPDDPTIPFNDDPGTLGDPRNDETAAGGVGRNTMPMEAPPRRSSAFAVAESEDVIGNYRLVERVGMGGMGEVWIAEQERPVRRRVALKLIRTGMNTGQFVARFEAERQALAMMDHPNIAKVLDAGTTARNLPFFVMEFVPGKPITEFCEEHALDTAARLQLFAQVCDGVQHAHEKAIIHRDLKPSNVLVMEVDGRPVPKIIDFGIAKTLAQPLTEAAFQTQAGALVGTLEYMSPEQLDFSGDVDTRTDVYSLGVVLYELLAGTLPFNTTDIGRTGLEEFRRRVREEDPVLPSTRVTLAGKPPSGVAQSELTRAGPDIGALRRTLRGDLDWIVMRALEKDRTRRYASPRDLSADVERYLKSEPVLAHPPSGLYRARKFARRHPLAVLGAVATVLVIVALGYGLRRASLAEAVARHEAAKTEAVNTFLQGMLASANPEQTLGREVTVREMLDQAASGENEALQGQWDIQAEVRSTIGNTYESLGLYEKAEPELARALEMRRRQLAPDDPEVAESLHDLGRVRWQAGDLEGGQKLIEEALAIYRKEPEKNGKTIATCLNDLGVVRQSRGDLAQAEGMFREALELRRKLQGPESRETAETLSNVAWTRYFQGDVAGAEPLFVEALDVNRKLLGPLSPLVLTFELNLAAVSQRLGKSEEAGKLYEDALQGMRQVLGPEHSTTLRAMMSYAEFDLEQGRTDTAEPLLSEALATSERTLGRDHELTIRLVADTGWLARLRGDNARSAQSYRETLDRRVRTLGPSHPDAIRARWQVARALADQGRYADAEGYAREALDRSRRANPAVPENTGMSLLYLGLARLGRQDAKTAETFLKECVDLRGEQPVSEGAWETAYARHALGAAIGRQGRYAEADSILREAWTQLEERPTPAPRRAEARERMTEFYRRWAGREPAAAAAGRARWQAAAERPAGG